mmetsp:Transcript_1584/g.2790  ORF Transcript_1584/g.2790 Transcript_1584/m.2790 type:complete len:152 (-) Transcript_1584:1988-2443(-)
MADDSKTQNYQVGENIQPDQISFSSDSNSEKKQLRKKKQFDSTANPDLVKKEYHPRSKSNSPSLQSHPKRTLGASGAEFRKSRSRSRSPNQFSNESRRGGRYEDRDNAEGEEGEGKVKRKQSGSDYRYENKGSRSPTGFYEHYEKNDNDRE